MLSKELKVSTDWGCSLSIIELIEGAEFSTVDKKSMEFTFWTLKTNGYGTEGHRVFYYNSPVMPKGFTYKGGVSYTFLADVMIDSVGYSDSTGIQSALMEYQNKMKVA